MLAYRNHLMRPKARAFINLLVIGTPSISQPWVVYFHVAIDKKPRRIGIHVTLVNHTGADTVKDRQQQSLCIWTFLRHRQEKALYPRPARVLFSWSVLNQLGRYCCSFQSFPISLILFSQISFIHGKCLEHFFFQLTLVALRFMHLCGIYKGNVKRF